MIYTEEQSKVILNSKDNLVNQVVRDNGNIKLKEERSKLEVKEIIHHENRGRNHTTEERALLGTMARAGLGTRQEIADEFHVSRNAVNNYANGEVSYKSTAT